MDEFALEILQRKYATCGTQTEFRGKDLPKRLRKVEVAELMRCLKVMSELKDVYGDIASGEFGDTIRQELLEAKREKKADTKAKTEKEGEPQRHITEKEGEQGSDKDEAKVCDNGEDGIDVPFVKHEDRDRDQSRGRSEDRAGSVDRRSLPRPGRTPPRLPRQRSQSPERNPQ